MVHKKLLMVKEPKNWGSYGNRKAEENWERKNWLEEKGGIKYYR